MRTGLAPKSTGIFLALLAAGCGYSGPSIETEALKEVLDSHARPVTVIDVRPAVQYEAGHLEGALNVPLESLDGKIDEIGRIKGEVMIICTCGRRSLAAIEKLSERGVIATLVVGGQKRWVELGFPVVKGG